jgi:type VI secretion system protein ImpK
MAANSSLPVQEGKAGEAGGAGENLPLLYQGLLTGIIRLQGQRQRLPDGESFRRRTKATLQEIERVAVAGGYDGRDVRDSHFAVVAFLDEAILHSKDPVRAEWERLTLQQDLFGQTDAGVVFFEKLEQFRARRDSEQLADILEVYLLCLLLGFEGRYAGGKRGELEGLTESLRMRIEYIRGRAAQISPSAALPPAAAAPPAPAQRPARHLQLVTLGLVIFTIVLFWILRSDLISYTEELRGRVL